MRKDQKVALIWIAVLIPVVAALWWLDSVWGPGYGPGDRYLVPNGYHGWLIVERKVKGAPDLPVARNFDDPNVRDHPHGYYEYILTTARPGYIAVPDDRSDVWHGPDESFYFGGGQRTPILMEDGILSELDKRLSQRFKNSNTVAFWEGFNGYYNMPGKKVLDCDAWFVGTYREFVRAKAATDGAAKEVQLVQSMRH